jgi:hypothetical protein
MGKRELTGVEKAIIRAIYAEAGPSSMVTYLCELAAESNAKAEREAESVADRVARIKAEEKADLDREAEAIRRAKAEELAAVSGALGVSDQVGARPSAIVVGLTVREAGMLVRIGETDYNDGDPEGSTWANVVCDNRADAALMANLSKKGHICCVGSGREATVALTDTGLAAYRKLRPDSEYVRRGVFTR